MVAGIVLTSIGSVQTKSRWIWDAIEIGFWCVFLLAVFTDSVGEQLGLLALILLAYITIYQKGVIAHLCNRKFFAHLGRITYSMYLNQIVVIFVLGKVTNH